MANPLRGELQVKLGGKTYDSRLTVDGCMQIEAACGVSLVKLANVLSEGELSLSDLANIITPALRGGGNDVDVSAVAKIIYQAGVAEGMRVAAELLVNVLTAGSNDDDESAEGNAEEMSPA